MLCATSPFWNLTCWLCGHTLLRQVYCSITCPSLADWKFDGLYHVPWFFVSCRTAIWHWDIWYLSHLLPLATLALGYCPLLPSILHYHTTSVCSVRNGIHMMNTILMPPKLSLDENWSAVPVYNCVVLLYRIGWSGFVLRAWCYVQVCKWYLQKSFGSWHLQECCKWSLRRIHI